MNDTRTRTQMLADYQKLEREANLLAQELDLARIENRRMRGMLEECLDWLEERYDVDDGENYNEAVPNAEMKLGTSIEEALGRGGRYGL